MQENPEFQFWLMRKIIKVNLLKIETNLQISPTSSSAKPLSPNYIYIFFNCTTFIGTELIEHPIPSDKLRSLHGFNLYDLFNW